MMFNTEREVAIDAVVENVVGFAHRAIFVESDLDSAEARLAWVTVVEKMVQSMLIDRTSEVLREQLRENLG